MKAKFLGCLAVAFALALVPGCGKTEFKEFTSPEGKFSILMPGDPERKTQDLLGKQLIFFSKNLRHGSYGVGFLDIPPGFPINLPGAAEGATNAHAGKVTLQREYTFEGTKGLEFEGETTKPKGYVSGRVIVLNNRFFQILALGSNARLSDPDVQKFLTSFQLMK